MVKDSLLQKKYKIYQLRDEVDSLKNQVCSFLMSEKFSNFYEPKFNTAKQEIIYKHKKLNIEIRIGHKEEVWINNIPFENEKFYWNFESYFINRIAKKISDNFVFKRSSLKIKPSGDIYKVTIKPLNVSIYFNYRMMNFEGHNLPIKCFNLPKVQQFIYNEVFKYKLGICQEEAEQDFLKIESIVKSLGLKKGLK